MSQVIHAFVYIPPCRANATLRKVYSLALLHIYEDRVTSACAAFVEMLGLDSGFLRVDLEAARRIIEFGDGVNFELNEGGSLSDEMKLIKEEKRQSTGLFCLCRHVAVFYQYSRNSLSTTY